MARRPLQILGDVQPEEGFRIDPGTYIPGRDQIYPSQIAAERPALTTKITCHDGNRFEDTRKGLRGGLQPEHTDERCAEFNRALRAGHGFRNSGEE